MPVVAFSESEVEEAALAWFEALGYRVLFGPDIAPGEVAAERADYSEVGPGASSEGSSWPPVVWVPRG